MARKGILPWDQETGAGILCTGDFCDNLKRGSLFKPFNSSVGVGLSFIKWKWEVERPL